MSECNDALTRTPAQGTWLSTKRIHLTGVGKTNGRGQTPRTNLHLVCKYRLASTYPIFRQELFYTKVLAPHKPAHSRVHLGTRRQRELQQALRHRRELLRRASDDHAAAGVKQTRQGRKSAMSAHGAFACSMRKWKGAAAAGHNGRHLLYVLARV